MNGPSLQSVVEARNLDDAMVHFWAGRIVLVAEECAADGVFPLDLLDDLTWLLKSKRLTNSAAREVRLAIEKLEEATSV